MPGAAPLPPSRCAAPVPVKGSSIMPATLIPTHLGAKPTLTAHDEHVCQDCKGTAVDIDSDGSQTGFVGTLIPCICTGAEHGTSPVCDCHIDGWPLDGGLTGWVVATYEDDDCPFYAPCPTHAPARASGIQGVAA